MNQIAIEGGLAVVIQNYGSQEVTVNCPEGKESEGGIKRFTLKLNLEAKALDFIRDGVMFNSLPLDVEDDDVEEDDIILEFLIEVDEFFEKMYDKVPYMFVEVEENNYIDYRELKNVE